MKENQPSFTALFIAFAVVVLGQTCCTLLPPGIVPVQMALLEAVGLPMRDYYFLFLLRSSVGPVISRVLVWFAGLLCKDCLQCVAFRKSFIERHVRQFLQQHKGSNPQVLILGAGYDTLSLRLARNEENVNVHFWEIDHPATGSCKERVWRERKNTATSPHRVIGEKPPNIFTAAVDLTQKNALMKTLRAQKDNYNASSPTIVVMEGLLMYFSTEHVYHIFEEVSKVVGPGSVAVFDMLATTYDKNNNRHSDIGFISPFANFLVRMKGEPWLIGLDPTILGDFLAKSECWTLRAEVQSYGPARLASIEMNGNAKSNEVDGCNHNIVQHRSIIK